MLITNTIQQSKSFCKGKTRDGVVLGVTHNTTPSHTCTDKKNTHAQTHNRHSPQSTPPTLQLAYTYHTFHPTNPHILTYIYYPPSHLYIHHRYTTFPERPALLPPYTKENLLGRGSEPPPRGHSGSYHMCCSPATGQ